MSLLPDNIVYLPCCDTYAAEPITCYDMRCEPAEIIGTTETHEIVRCKSCKGMGSKVIKLKDGAE